MASSQDTEITLGTGKLLVLFFGLVAICAAFFAVGYSLGRKSEPGITTASAAPSEPKPDSNTTQANSASSQTQTPAGNTPDPTTTLPSASYFVQVAAVSKQEDAEALVEALKKKQYPAFTANNSTADKFYHVQVGPYTELKEAEAMRARLIGDGYNPIVKK